MVSNPQKHKNESKNIKAGLHETIKLLHSKGNTQQSKVMSQQRTDGRESLRCVHITRS